MSNQLRRWISDNRGRIAESVGWIVVWILGSVIFIRFFTEVPR